MTWRTPSGTSRLHFGVFQTWERWIFLSGLSAKKSTFTCSHQISAPLLNPWPLSTWTPQSSSFSPSWPEKKDWEGRKVLQESEAAGPDVQAGLMQCSSISVDISQCLKVCRSFFLLYFRGFYRQTSATSFRCKDLSEMNTSAKDTTWCTASSTDPCRLSVRH